MAVFHQLLALALAQKLEPVNLCSTPSTLRANRTGVIEYDRTGGNCSLTLTELEAGGHITLLGVEEDSSCKSAQTQLQINNNSSFCMVQSSPQPPVIEIAHNNQLKLQVIQPGFVVGLRWMRYYRSEYINSVV
jgi:hypothetical protein